MLRVLRDPSSMVPELLDRSLTVRLATLTVREVVPSSKLREIVPSPKLSLGLRSQCFCFFQCVSLITQALTQKDFLQQRGETTHVDDYSWLSSVPALNGLLFRQRDGALPPRSPSHGALAGSPSGGSSREPLYQPLSTSTSRFTTQSRYG